MLLNWRIGAALTLALSSAACGDSTGPDGLAGSYTLVAAEDQRLPFTLEEDFGPFGKHTRKDLIEGSLRLQTNGSFELRRKHLVLYHDAEHDELYEDAIEPHRGTYTVSGDSIQLGPPGLVGYDHRGTVQGRQITLRWSGTELDL